MRLRVQALHRGLGFRVWVRLGVQALYRGSFGIMEKKMETTIRLL